MLSFNVWSRVRLDLVPDKPSTKQGEIVTGKLIVKQTDGQTVLSGLKGKKFGNILYLLNVAPFMGKQGQLVSDAKFIFITVPETNSISDVINGEEVVINWESIEVVPIEAPKSFLLGEFDIPARKKIVQWLLIILGIALFVGVILYIRKIFLKKSLLKKQIASIKTELISCSNYNDIVKMWSAKQRYLETFPALENNFRNLELVLFKYQFKALRTESEVQEVVLAYNKFKAEVPEVINAG